MAGCGACAHAAVGAGRALALPPGVCPICARATATRAPCMRRFSPTSKRFAPRASSSLDLIANLREKNREEGKSELSCKLPRPPLRPPLSPRLRTCALSVEYAL